MKIEWDINPISNKKQPVIDGIPYADMFYYFANKCPWRIPDFDCWYDCSVQLVKTSLFSKTYKQCTKDNCAIYYFFGVLNETSN